MLSGILIHSIIIRLLDRPKSDELFFEINGQVVSYSLKDIALISGLKCNGDTTPREWSERNKLNTRIVDKYFGGLRQLRGRTSS